MADKELVTLTILVGTTDLSWWVAAIRDNGEVQPLLRSEPGDLDRYRDLSWDEQTSFLRHRFCNVLQRGCDRLWGHGMKARLFLFVLESDFPHAEPELTVRTADHLVQWMSQPPVIFVKGPWRETAADPERFHTIAGELDDSELSAVRAASVKCRDHDLNSDQWEPVSAPKG